MGLSLTNIIGIAPIDETRVFTLDEANNLVPLIARITAKYAAKAEKIMSEQRFFQKTYAPLDKIQKCDLEMGKLLNEWGLKLRKLGAYPLANGFVGINAGSFYWSWHADEKEIGFYHDFGQGGHERRALSVIRRLREDET